MLNFLLMEGLDVGRQNLDASKNDLRARLANAGFAPETEEQMNHLIGRARSQRDIDQISETLTPFETGSSSTESNPAPNQSFFESHLFLNTATNEQGYWQNGQTKIFNDAAKAERKRQEENPNSPPQGGFPKFGQIVPVTSWDEVPEIQAELEAEAAAQAAQQQGPQQAPPGVPPQPPGVPPGTPPPGGPPGPQGPRAPRDLNPRDRKQTQDDIRDLLRRSRLTDHEKERLEERVARLKTDVDADGIWDDLTSARESVREKEKDEREKAERQAENQRSADERMREFEFAINSESQAFDRQQERQREQEIHDQPAPPAGEEAPADWEGRFFEGSFNKRGNQNTWQRFDIGRYGDIKVLTMEEITHNQLYQSLLGDLMSAMDDRRAGIMDRLHDPNADMSDDDRKFLKYAQYELSRVVDKFAPLERSLNDSQFKEIFLADPEMKEVMELAGVKPHADAVRGFMMRLAVRHQGAADDFLDAYKKWNDPESRKAAQEAEKEIQNICTEIGITRENYERFIVPGDREATIANLDAHFRENAKGWYEKWTNRAESDGYLKMMGSSSHKAEKYARRALKVSPDRARVFKPGSWTLGDVHQAKMEMARFFKMSLEPTFQKEMERYALGLRDTMPAGPAASVNTAGPHNAAEASAMTDADLTLENLRGKFNRDREPLAQSRGFASWEATPPNVQEAIFDNWSPAEYRESVRGRNRGWFSRLMRAIGRKLLGDKKREFKQSILANA